LAESIGKKGLGSPLPETSSPEKETFARPGGGSASSWGMRKGVFAIERKGGVRREAAEIAARMHAAPGELVGDLRDRPLMHGGG